jgi:hypothetical protein
MNVNPGNERHYKFTFKGRLWGINEVIDNAKQHWGAYKDPRDRLLEKIGWIIVSANPEAMDRIGIKIAWYEKDKRRNKDNIIAGGLKLILDALQAEGVIKNDGWKEIGTLDLDNFFVDKLNPRIEVEIWEEKDV